MRLDTVHVKTRIFRERTRVINAVARGLLVLFTICVLPAIADDGCASGYHLDTTINATTFITTFGGDCMSDENSGLIGAPIYYPIAYPLNDTLHCGVGQHYTTSGCVTNTHEPCKSGYSDSGTNTGNMFIASIGGECPDGYNSISTRAELSYAIETATTKCGFGYHPTANGCVANDSTGCPAGYVGAYMEAFDRYNANSECETGFELYDPNAEMCHTYLGGDTADVCTPLCEYGYDHTGADTCAHKCTATNMSTIRVKTASGTPYIWQLWADKTTTPSINIRVGDNTCYMNLVPENQSGTINIKYGNNAYHGVDLK